MTAPTYATAATVINAVGALLTMPGVVTEDDPTPAPVPIPFFIGRKYLPENSVPPRHVWIPANDSFGPSEKFGYGPRSIATRNAGFDVHVWAASYAAAEELANRMMAAIRRVSQRFCQFGSITWHADDQWESMGANCVLSVTLMLPVTDTIEASESASVVVEGESTVVGVGATAGDDVTITDAVEDEDSLEV